MNQNYMDLKTSLTEFLDNEVLSGNVKAWQVQQILEALEQRFTGWADGRVPAEIIDDLISRWHNGEGNDKPLHEFLRITEVQYKRWLEAQVQKDIKESRLRKEQSCQRK